MTTLFDRKAFYDAVRMDPFPGQLGQEQVDGMEGILAAWENHLADEDLRWLAYCLASTMHETGSRMIPVKEVGGTSQPYGAVDPVTGQTYEGRGQIQVTHRSNYCRTDTELGLSGDDSCEWHADNMLRVEISARAMFQGMIQGWFRGDANGPHNLPRYFSHYADDPFNARQILNGDRNTVPGWSNGVSIGHLIEGYHHSFLAALEASLVSAEPTPPPEPDMPQKVTMTVTLRITTEGPVTIEIADDMQTE